MQRRYNADTEEFEIVCEFRCKIDQKYSGIKRKCGSLCIATPAHLSASKADTEGFEAVSKFRCKIDQKYSGIERKCRSLCIAG